MIIKEKGHFRSYRTPEEAAKLIGYELGDLSESERRCAMMIIEEEIGTGSSSIGQEIAADQWEIQPVPIEQWINDPELVGDIHKSIFPRHKQDIIDFFNGDYHEYILTGGIGVGKTFTATVCIMRVLYELLCLKNPQTTLGLSPGSPLYIAPISKTKELARRVAFGQIAGKLNLSPFFRGKFIETKEEVRFPDKGIYIIGGTSNNAHILGMDVIAGLVDEGNFMGRGKMSTMSDDEAYDKAEVIYNGLVSRIQSRFSKHGVRGFVFLVSSKRGAEDFTERRIRAAQESLSKPPKTEGEIETYMQSLGVFVRDYSAWDVAPDSYADQKWHTLAFNPETGRSRVIDKDAKLTRGEDGIDFPNDFLPDFERDPIGSLRDKAGVSVEVAHPFITNRTFIDEMMAHDMPHIFGVSEWTTEEDLVIYWDKFMSTNMRGEPAPLCCPGAMRHVALDMSVKEDATGFCIAHDAGMTKVVRRNSGTGKEGEEYAPVIHIDAVLRIIPPSAGEIEHECVRNLIYTLQENGLPIRSVSMDQWSRPPNAQLFKKHGLKVIEISMDRKPMQYLTARASLYERRVHCPYSEVLRKELRRLERTDKGKIDHPLRGSKDLADVWGATIWYLTEISTGHRVYVPSKGYSDDPVVKGTWQTGGNYLWPDEKPDNKDNEKGLPRYIVT